MVKEMESKKKKRSDFDRELLELIRLEEENENNEAKAESNHTELNGTGCSKDTVNQQSTEEHSKENQPQIDLIQVSTEKENKDHYKFFSNNYWSPNFYMEEFVSDYLKILKW